MSDRHGWPGVFIFGAPRSGTTLLRLMLDAHPQLAIPPETHFLREVLLRNNLSEISPERFCALVLQTPRWRDYGLESKDLETALKACTPFSVRKGLEAFYRIYSLKFGKHKWGDKTPENGLILNQINAIMPRAVFIHLVRDGRDVYLSLKSTWFGEEISLVEHAKYWSRCIRTTELFGQRCRKYMMIRYEDLVRNTKEELKKICRFSGLEYTDLMLRYYERAGDRIDELQDYRTPSGRWVPKEQRAAIHQLVRSEPDEGRAFRWTREMSNGDARRYVAVAAGELSRLGYVLC